MADIEITTAPVETTLADSDEMYFNDVSETPDAINRITWGNIKATFKAYYDTASATLTGKTVDLTTNTLITTLAQLNSSISDDNVVGASGGTFTGDINVPDEAYGVGWNASTEVPTKNAVYDKIESLVIGGGSIGGSTGATDNAIIRADGGGGATVQSSLALVDDAGHFLTPAGAFYNTPILALTGATTTGVGSNGTYLSLVRAGTAEFAVTDNVVGVRRDSHLAWNSVTTGAADSGFDTGIQRLSAGVLKVTNGGAGAGSLTVADEAYNATTWDGSLQVPTKNAVRDQLEDLLTTLTASIADAKTYIDVDADNVLPASPDKGQVILSDNGSLWVAFEDNSWTQVLTALSQQFSLGNNLPSDDTWEGTSIDSFNQSAALTQWQAVYLDGTSEWALADANGSGTYPARGLFIDVIPTTDIANVFVHGIVRNDAWSWTPGGTIYLSTTAGGLTQTAPSASGEIVQAVGYALTADKAFFDFNSTYLTVE